MQYPDSDRPSCGSTVARWHRAAVPAGRGYDQGRRQLRQLGRRLVQSAYSRRAFVKRLMLMLIVALTVCL